MNVRYSLLTFFKKHRSTLIAIALFISLFYFCFGFQYGQGNNVEELPIIYKRAGFVQYPNDPFVLQSTSQFNAGSILLSTLGFFAGVVGLEGTPFLYLGIHLFTFLMLCFALVSILKQLSINTGHTLFFLLNLLLFANHKLHLIPNQRSLFWNHFDPEFIVVTLLFLAISFFLKNRYQLTAILLFISTLIHPLYSLPLGGTFIFIMLLSLKRAPKKSIYYTALYALCIFPYSLMLWYLSKQQMETIYNASLIHEFVRAPHHLVIPSFGSGNIRPYLRFFGSSFIMLGLTGFFWWRKYQPRKKQGILSILKNSWRDLLTKELRPLDKLLIILALLTSYLLGSSIIASFIRIPILVQLTPYRMGIFVFVLLFFVLSYYANIYFGERKKNIWNVLLQYFAPTILILFFFKIPNENNQRSEYQQDRKHVIQWIIDNTEAEAFFLNYTDVDIRTDCLRSDFFRFKTIPLNNNGQIDWYQRLLIYYCLPNHISGLNYKEVGAFQRNYPQTVDINLVLSKSSNWNLKYIILSQNNENQQIVGDEEYPILFKNNSFKVLDIKEN